MVFLDSSPGEYEDFYRLYFTSICFTLLLGGEDYDCPSLSPQVDVTETDTNSGLQNYKY